MAKTLKLFQLPKDESILCAPNSQIPFPFSKDIKDLIEAMKATVKAAPGIGLAAPQVGKNLMLAVINLEEFGVEPFAIINPRIISKSIKKTEMEEGCLSIPGYFALVRRPAKVEVEFFREDGRLLRMSAEKLLAKVFQHEIDHLSGVLINQKN
ncbi:MAG: peptide deformylase [bacterium]|nr:peptide deformylase [bacterium]